VVNPVEDAVESVVCPVTLSVPLDTSEDVAVIEPPVRVFTVPVTAVRIEEKKLVEVALVAVRFVRKPVVAPKSVAKKLVLVAFVIVLFVAYRFVAVSPVEDAVVSVACPVTSRVPVAVTFPPSEVLPITVSAEPGVDEPIPTRPCASITVKLVPALFFTSSRLVVPCPAPACTVSVVVPVVGVSFCTLKLMLDSRRLVVAFQRKSAFGVTSPRKKTSDESCASLLPLSELMLKVSLEVPEMVVDAAEIEFTFMLSA